MNIESIKPTEKIVTNNTNIFEVSSPEDLPLSDFHASMKHETFAIIRGVIAPDEVESALQTLECNFDHRQDNPVRGQSASAIRKNFQRLVIGGESISASNDDARLFRAFYNPMWEADIYGMRDVFTRLSRVRNQIAGLPKDFALDKIESNGLWTAARIHQYPSGGGFFRRHTDYIANDITDERSLEFYQVVLSMTRKGKHFNEGGAFVDKDEKRIILDDYAEPGDILIYDGRTQHGVEDIDPLTTLDMTTFNGRVAAFVTLFKVM